eukprot:274428-Chlamydomonas_euryale.AAC.4
MHGCIGTVCLPCMARSRHKTRVRAAPRVPSPFSSTTKRVSMLARTTLAIMSQGFLAAGAAAAAIRGLLRCQSPAANAPCPTASPLASQRLTLPPSSTSVAAPGL